MRRRALLTTLTAVGLAGCSALSPAPESYPQTTEKTAETGETPCPNQFNTKHTVCSAPPSDGPPVELSIPNRTLDLGEDDVPALRVRFENRSRDEVAVPIRLLREYDGSGWIEVTGWNSATVPTVPNGGSMAWSLSRTTHPTPEGVHPVVYEFTPGTYAFTIVVDLTPEREERQDVELSAVFTVTDSDA